jgi:hypothetical protein
MRTTALIGAVGLFIGGWSHSPLLSSELQPAPGGAPAARPLPAPAPAPKPHLETCTTCGENTYGTSIEFVGTPSEAANRAVKEQKLVFVLHVSGHFEDPGVT